MYEVEVFMHSNLVGPIVKVIHIDNKSLTELKGFILHMYM